MPQPSSNPSKSPTIGPFRLRLAETKDAPAILSIYSPFITHSITSLEFDVPTEAEMMRRIQSTLSNFPWLICETEKDGTVAGYAYASRHREREGYQWIAETAIYVSADFRGQGVGSILYKKLCRILTVQGYFQALAIISGKNEGSIEFHKNLGFYFVGSWKNCGNKFGKWCDVSWYSKQLQENYTDNPLKPRAFSEIQNLISLSDE